MLFDTHAHLEAIDDLKDTLKRAKETGVGKIITVGTSLESSKKAIEIAKKISDDDLQIYATCGLHPKDAKSELEKQPLDQCIDTLKQLAVSSGKVVGVGEAGLNYYVTGDPSTSHSTLRDEPSGLDSKSSGQAKPVTNDKEKGFQKKLFTEQIKLAADLNLPLIIHCRNAWSEIFDIIKTKRGETSFTGVFHSWTGNWQAAQKVLDLGFYISFSGIVTFKNASDIQEVAKKMPFDKILIETDSPFLSPEPLRGKQNEPKNVKIIAEFVSVIRKLPLNKFTGITAQNAQKLFNLK